MHGFRVDGDRDGYGIDINEGTTVTIRGGATKVLSAGGQGAFFHPYGTLNLRNLHLRDGTRAEALQDGSGAIWVDGQL